MKRSGTSRAAIVLLTVLAGSLTPDIVQAQPRRAESGERGPEDQVPLTPGSPAPPLGGTTMGGFDSGQGGMTRPAPDLGASTLGGFTNRNTLNEGELSRAFGQQPSSLWTGGPPRPGQAYQIPAPFAGYPPGTIITWGRYRYQLGRDGTMTSAGPIPGQPYQIPPEYANHPPGTVITKGRFRYQLGSNGTMTAYNAWNQDQDPVSATTDPPQTPRGPTPGERYQLPPEHAGAVPGSMLHYYGSSYVVGKDGTMTALGPSQ